MTCEVIRVAAAVTEPCPRNRVMRRGIRASRGLEVLTLSIHLALRVYIMCIAFYWYNKHNAAAPSGRAQRKQVLHKKSWVLFKRVYII